jgi:hypothetical protein
MSQIDVEAGHRHGAELPSRAPRSEDDQALPASTIANTHHREREVMDLSLHRARQRAQTSRELGSLANEHAVASSTRARSTDDVCLREVREVEYFYVDWPRGAVVAESPHEIKSVR